MHMLWILKQKQIECIPTRVVAPIWFIASNIEVEHQVLDHYSNSIIQEPILTPDEKYLLMCSEFRSIAEKAKYNEENFKLVRDTIQNLVGNFQYMNLNEQNSAREIQDISSIFEQTGNESSRRMILNPKTAQKVGRPKGKRILNPALSKKRNNRMLKNNKTMIN